MILEAQYSYKIIGRIEGNDLVVNPEPIIDTAVAQGDVIEHDGNALIVEQVAPLQFTQCPAWNSLMKVQ